MFEYHGWVSLRNDPHNIDGPELNSLIPELKEKIEEFDNNFDVIGFKEINVSYQFWIMGQRNHRQNWVFELFNFIATHASGSYGLLYVWDDEHPEYANEFRVWRMLRGRVEEMADPFLSPCIPTIEDPYDPEKDVR